MQDRQTPALGDLVNESRLVISRTSRSDTASAPSTFHLSPSTSSAIFRILIPRAHSKEVFIFALHTSFLVLRTYLSVLVARLDGAIVGDLVSANGKGFMRGLGLWFLLAIPSTYTNSMVRSLSLRLLYICA